MHIPPDSLEPETLRRVVEEFVTREGTDYGEVEVPTEAKVAEVIRQVLAGTARIYFDPATETTTIRPAE
ncbi:MAG: YheU family protein [Planctomycetota bacterium]|jgi:uncharacterized protein YheU (UPF0270 family)